MNNLKYKVTHDETAHEESARNFWRIQQHSGGRKGSRGSTKQWMDKWSAAIPFIESITNGKIKVITISGGVETMSPEEFLNIESYHRKYKARSETLRQIQEILLRMEPRLSLGDLYAAWYRPELVLKNSIRRDKRSKKVSDGKIARIRPRYVWVIGGRVVSRLQDIP